MEPDPQLSDEQHAKLFSFKEITQYDDADHQKIVTLLHNCQWNLEIAIQRFFDNNFSFPEASSTDTPAPDFGVASSPSPAPGHTATSGSGTRPRPAQLDDLTLSQFDLLPKFPKANRLSGNWRFTPGITIPSSGITPKSGIDTDNSGSSGLLNPLLFILLIIPKTLWFVLLKLNEVFRGVFPGFYDLWRPDTNSFPSSPLYLPEPPVSEKQEQLTSSDAYKLFSFKNHLEEVTKDITELPVFEGEFNDAYDIAKAQLKFLVVILVNDSNSSKLFLKHLVNSPDFSKLIADKYADRSDNFIIWGGHVDHLEGFMVGKAYRVARLPYIALVSNVSTYGETFPTMSLMKYSQSLNFENIEGDNVEQTAASLVRTRLKKLIKAFRRIASQYVIQLIDQKIDQDEKNFERLMKQQQDEAYYRSLEQDRLKKHKKDLVKQKQDLKKKRYFAKLQKEQRNLQKLKYELANWSKVLLEDNKKSDPIDIDGTVLSRGQFCLIQFKLPSGEKIVKKFSKERTLSDIYLFVQLKLILKALAEGGKEYKHEQDIFAKLEQEHSVQQGEVSDSSLIFKFELNSSFPKFKVPVDADTHIGDTKQLLPNCNLLVEYDLDYEDQLAYLVDNFDEPRAKVLTIDDIQVDDIKDLSSDEEDREPLNSVASGKEKVEK